MVRVGSLHYDIVADTEKFEKGIVATRRELRDAKKVFRETRTPAERLGQEIDDLGNLYRKGAIDMDTYRRKLKLLKKDHDIASGGVKAMVHQFKAMPTAIKASVASFSAFAVASSVMRTTAQQMEKIDELAKTSRKLGIDTSDLVTLRLAAEEFSGVSNGQLDTALQRMTRRIAEAANGTGEAQGALEELGVSAQELNAAGPAEAFRQIADAIQGVESQQDRLRLAFKLFDSEGAALVTTLSQGAAGFDSMKARAEELGIAISSIEAAQIEEANDAITEMKAAFDGAAQSYTVSIAPLIKDAASLFRQATINYRSNSQALGEWLGTWGQAERVIGNTAATMAEFPNSTPISSLPEAPVVEEDTRGEEYIDQLRTASELIGATREEMERLKILEMDLPESKEKQLLKELKLLQEQRKTLERWNEADREREATYQREMDRLKVIGQNIRESLKTPFDELVEDLAELDLLVNTGALDRASADRERARLEEEFAKNDSKPIKVELASSADKGSREEFEIIAKINSDRIKQRQLEEQRHKSDMEVQRAQKMAQERTNELLEELIANQPEPV